MIPRIKTIEPQPAFKLLITFDGGEKILYDVEEDIEQIPAFQILKTEAGLFNNFQIDESRTCVFWSDMIDLPSDTLLEYGQKVKQVHREEDVQNNRTKPIEDTFNNLRNILNDNKQFLLKQTINLPP